MSVLPKDSIKIVAESISLPNLKDEIAGALASDVEYRMREIIQEAAKFMRHSKREVLTTADVSHALRLRNVEAIYGYSSSDPLRFVKAVGTTDLFFLEDKELDFNEIISAPLPKCPYEASISMHWLAVEGVQPSIRQNPSQEEIVRENNAPTKKPRTIEITGEKTTQAGVEVKPVVKHVISKELQIYYEKITEAIKGNDEALLQACLNSLTNDPGIHQLLPYFALFVSDEVTHNLKNLRLLKSLMRMVKAILDSPHFHVDLYLHQFMPAILTCLVGKELCENSNENHWELRDDSANLIAYVCRRFGKTYKNLQPRITKTLMHALLDHSRPMTTHYGAIVGLSNLGALVIESLILPQISNYYHSILEPNLKANSSEARRCYGALLHAAGLYLGQAIDRLSPDHPLRKIPTQDDVEIEETEEVDGEVQKEEKETESKGETSEMNGKEQTIEEEGKEKENRAEGDDTMNIEGEVKENENAKEANQQAKETEKADSARERYVELYEIFGESLSPYLLNSASASASHNLFI